MKVAIASILLLVGLDFAFNHGGATHRLHAHLQDSGASIAAWVNR